MKRSVIAKFLAASSVYLLAGAASAEEIAPSPETSVPAQQLVASFTVFAGSEENASSLVNGLRSGGLITLTPTTPAAAVGGTTNDGSLAFMPPTRPMGWGNVRHALTLAQRQLAAQGISNPTPDQLQAALMGGSVITATGQTASLPGTLTLRSQGMGWGQIAHTVGAPLGNAASIQASSHGSGAATARAYRVGAVTTASGEVVRAAHWSSAGSRQVRIDNARSAQSGGAPSLPAASTPTASAIGLGTAAAHRGLGTASHGRGR